MNVMPNCCYRISIKALIFDESKEKFLLVQEPDGRWEFPGGGLEFHESPAEGLRREMKEEAGLEITWMSTNPSYFLTDLSGKGTRYANVFYEVQVKDLEFIPSEECVALKFFSLEELRHVEVFSNVSKFAELFSKNSPKIS